MNSIYHNDLLKIVQSLDEVESSFQGKKIFITGGTGFLGKWKTDTFLKLGAQITIFTRSIEKTTALHPKWKNNPQIQWLEGSLDQIPELEGSFDILIHGANDLKLTAQQTLKAAQKFFDFAERSKIKNVLLMSSGSATFYDPQKNNPYAEGKILIEAEGKARAARNAFDFKIIRSFAFLGPYQDLESNFAAAQFFKFLLEEKPISIQGDGSPVRSFLYPTDFVIGVLKVLTKGKSGVVYEFGSDEPTTIRELAEKINECRDGAFQPVQVLNQASPSLSNSNVYLPKLDLIKIELGFQVQVKLNEAIGRTAEFYRETFPNSKIRAPMR